VFERIIGRRCLPPLRELLCLAISSPRSQASERRSAAGSLQTCRHNGHPGGRVCAVHFDQCSKTRMTFHQGCDVTVVGAAQADGRPNDRDGAVFDFGGLFPDGDGTDDLTTAMSASTGLPQAADPALSMITIDWANYLLIDLNGLSGSFWSADGLGGTSLGVAGLSLNT
jgi:hypothetical protein